MKTKELVEHLFEEVKMLKKDITPHQEKAIAHYEEALNDGLPDNSYLWGMKMMIAFTAGRSFQQKEIEGRFEELQTLKVTLEKNLEIYRHLMESDSDATKFQKGKNRGAFFAYKNMLDSTTT